MAKTIASNGCFILNSDDKEAGDNMMIVSQIEGTKYFSIVYQGEQSEADGSFTLCPSNHEGSKVNLLMQNAAVPSGSEET